MLLKPTVVFYFAYRTQMEGGGCFFPFFESLHMHCCLDTEG